MRSLTHSDPMEANVQIGDFRIERRLGAGGMGIVYLARQVSLDRPVALKVLGSALTRPSEAARFQREAQAAARLKHPGIATIYFVGQDRQLCYMAMEYIDGASLRQTIDRLTRSRQETLNLDSAAVLALEESGQATAQRFDVPAETADFEPTAAVAVDGPVNAPESTVEMHRMIESPTYVRRCCEIARDAARALEAAHQQGVIHRDIKPENILLDRQGNVHLIDFGIARFFEDATITRTGQLVGTPMYMSPEQVAGRLQVDHRTDIYSLGLVLYELLAIRRPVEAPTREALLRKIVTKTLIPVSWHNAAVTTELQGIAHKAAAKDPDDRYSTATALADDLDRFLAGQPVAARPYRHEFDRTEVVASRPVSVMVAAFLFFLVACALSVVALTTLLMPTFDQQASQFRPYTLDTFQQRLPHFAGVGIVVFLSGAVGHGLMTGRRMARWIASLLALLALTLTGWIASGVLLNLFLEEPDNSVGPMLIVGLANTMLGFAACAWTVCSLWRKRVRDWFHFAQAQRQEHFRQRRPAVTAGLLPRT